MKEQVIKAFDQLAIVYEKSIDSNSLFNTEYERPAMLSELPEDLSGKKVLDAGCAAGWYTEQLVKRGANVFATDISPEMVSATKRRVGNHAEVFQLDLEGKMPFEDNTFDYIISSLTLHYIQNWDKTFSEFKRILKNNGVLLFSVHHPFMDIRILEDYHYFSVELIVDSWNKDGKVYEVPFYRRPLQSILNETAKHFILEKVIEPKPTERFKEQAPEKYEKLLKNPNFLIIKSVHKTQPYNYL